MRSNKIYILHTLVEPSRYNDINYSIWFVENDIVIYTSIILDPSEFDNLMNLSQSEKYDSIRETINRKRIGNEIWEIDVPNDDLGTANNEKKLKSDLLVALRNYKLKQIIK